MGSLLGLSAIRDAETLEKLAKLAGKEVTDFKTSLQQHAQDLQETIDDEIHEARHGWKRHLLADANISEATMLYLKISSFYVTRSIRSLGKKARDEKIFAYARKRFCLIMTHDRDFLDSKRFNYRYSPGVIILPNPPNSDIPGKPYAYEPLKAAIDHLQKSEMRPVCAWFDTKVAEYSREGELRLYSYAPRRTGKNRFDPEVQKLRYF